MIRYAVGIMSLLTALAFASEVAGVLLDHGFVRFDGFDGFDDCWL